MDERGEMPTCNFVEIVYNKWLQQFNNIMICLYEMTLDDLICVFMQIANYLLWIKGGSTSKGPCLLSSRLKIVGRCGDPKLFADARKFYPRA